MESERRPLKRHGTIYLPRFSSRQQRKHGIIDEQKTILYRSLFDNYLPSSPTTAYLVVVLCSTFFLKKRKHIQIIAYFVSPGLFPPILQFSLF